MPVIDNQAYVLIVQTSHSESRQNLSNSGSRRKNQQRLPVNCFSEKVLLEILCNCSLYKSEISLGRARVSLCLLNDANALATHTLAPALEVDLLEIESTSSAWVFNAG